MHDVILWCGFAGAWLLVLGPVYQAAVELRDEEIERDRIEEAARMVEKPEGSGWWWMLPPVGYVVAMRRRHEFQQAVFHQLRPEDMRALIRYFDKATGWYIVGGGALLIAASETWEVVERYEWPQWTFWVLVVALVLVVMAYVGRCSDRWRRLSTVDGQG